MPKRGEKVALAYSTGGCGTVPPRDQLNDLPGDIVIFYDRQDEPKKDGQRPGDEGALKLASALSGRGRVGLVPMPHNCNINGWDVSNALDEGFGWEDFQQVAVIAVVPAVDVRDVNSDSGSILKQFLQQKLPGYFPKHCSLSFCSIVRRRRSTNTSTNSGNGISSSFARRSKVSKVGLALPLNHSDQFLISTPTRRFKSLYDKAKKSSLLVGAFANMSVIINCVGYKTKIAQTVKHSCNGVPTETE